MDSTVESLLPSTWKQSKLMAESDGGSHKASGVSDVKCPEFSGSRSRGLILDIWNYVAGDSLAKSRPPPRYDPLALSTLALPQAPHRR